MARSDLNYGDNLKRMSELSSYKIESGDPDPRGWTVSTADGRDIGVVEDLVIDTSAMKVRHFLVSNSGGMLSGASGSDTFLLDAADVDVRESSRQLVATRFDVDTLSTTAAAYDRDYTAGRSYTDTDTDYTERDGKRITRSEEELHVGKREVERGEAVVGKHVETERVSEPVTRRREEVVVERRPVQPGARADAATIGEDEIRIPLMEEELIVEKRPVVKEELIVGKRIVEERDTVEAEVRREEFDIDTDASGGVRERDRNRNER